MKKSKATSVADSVKKFRGRAETRRGTDEESGDRFRGLGNTLRGRAEIDEESHGLGRGNEEKLGDFEEMKKSHATLSVDVILETACAE